MDYMIISLLTILLFTYIVHIVTNRILAIKIHIKFLILCACCALLISLILPRIFIGFAGLTGTLGIVTLFALISSYCIASYYDDTMEKLALKNALTTNSIEVPEVLQIDEEEYPTANEGIEQRDHIVAEESCACLSEEIVEAAENTRIITEFVDKKYFYPVKCEERNRIPMVVEQSIIQPNNSEILLKNVVEIDKEAKVFSNFMNFKNRVNAMSTPLILEAIHKHLDSPISNEIYDSYPSSKDLDILMDFAFSQKEQRNFLQALTFFREALKLYPDSEAAPFLVMEVGTILKNLGSYNEALEVFTEGRLLPRVINNNMLEQEFINNIAYLRIVKNILIQNSLEFMPFNSIPDNVFNEINAEFCEWRNQSQ